MLLDWYRQRSQKDSQGVGLSIFHRFSHWFGWFHSTTEVWTESSSRGEVWMVGYRCEECGELYGVHETLTGVSKRRG